MSETPIRVLVVEPGKAPYEKQVSTQGKCRRLSTAILRGNSVTVIEAIGRRIREVGDALQRECAA